MNNGYYFTDKMLAEQYAAKNQFTATYLRV